MKKYIYFLNTFGEAYWPQKSFHETPKDIMHYIDQCIRHEYLESSNSDHEVLLATGYYILRIDTHKCPRYRELFIEKKIDKLVKRKERLLKKKEEQMGQIPPT